MANYAACPHALCCRNSQLRLDLPVWLGSGRFDSKAAPRGCFPPSQVRRVHREGGRLQRKPRTKTPKKQVPPAKEVAKELLEPILRFLAVSGMTHAAAKQTFEIAWRGIANEKSKVRVNHLASSETYVELVGAWTRLPDYLDRHGNPRDLAMGGSKGFRALVAAADPNLSPDLAIGVLQTYGNVMRLKSKRYKLLKPFFHVHNKSAVAFEPSARFLADASATVNCLIRPDSTKEMPKLFWRVADSQSLPDDQVQLYLDFARRRSLVFLQEIDDWLQLHGEVAKPDSNVARAGLGVFSICSLAHD